MVQVHTLRYTPAGVPALNLLLEHSSEVMEAGTARSVKLQLKAVAFGARAETLSRQGLDAVCEFHGFLTNGRNGKGIEFHIQDFSKI